VPEHPSTLERLVFFSDAVFAIAITLLAIDLRLPTVSANTNAALLEAIRDTMPALFAFVLSFVIVGGFWIGHLRTLRVVERTSPRFVGLNLLFLLFVALLPFPTSVIAEYGNLSLAAVVYAGFGAVTGALSTVLWLYATQFSPLAPSVTPEISRSFAIRALVAPVMFAASIPVALLNPFAAEVMWLLEFPTQSIVSRRLGIDQVVARSLSAD
jgi:TMEM175 potassium channel family protein